MSPAQHAASPGGRRRSRLVDRRIVRGLLVLVRGSARCPVDAAPERAGSANQRVFVFLPGQVDWLATGVQLIGALEFNVSTAVAIWADVGSTAARHHVWRPDVLGSDCFLIASGWRGARCPMAGPRGGPAR
jgi:hypothetical protein